MPTLQTGFVFTILPLGETYFFSILFYLLSLLPLFTWGGLAEQIFFLSNTLLHSYTNSQYNYRLTAGNGAASISSWGEVPCSWKFKPLRYGGGEAHHSFIHPPHPDFSYSNQQPSSHKSVSLTFKPQLPHGCMVH